MTDYVADLSWKSGARAIEKLDRLRSTVAVNVLIAPIFVNLASTPHIFVPVSYIEPYPAQPNRLTNT